MLIEGIQSSVRGRRCTRRVILALVNFLYALYGKPCDHSNIYHLEELLGCVSKSARKPMQPFLGLDGFTMNYEAS